MTKCFCCIHCNVCAKVPEIFENCRYFLDRNQVIVPPCPIGGDIYILITKKLRRDCETFSLIKKSKLTYSNLERVIEDIGDTVFLTEEEARDALRELQA